MMQYKSARFIYRYYILRFDVDKYLIPRREAQVDYRQSVTSILDNHGSCSPNRLLSHRYNG